MRFKLDENLPRDARIFLADAGRDVRSVSDEQADGGPDARVLEARMKEDRILVTLDRDDSDTRAYPPSSHRGIRVLRRVTLGVENILAVLKKSAAGLCAKEPTDRRPWSVEETRVRTRE
ncbi:MAG: DUF5615 family PIN-like protein [Burkholderiales bacterium]|nr:DUF5615 family PIN-like protein [Burkholderiales bacterium]